MNVMAQRASMVLPGTAVEWSTTSAIVTHVERDETELVVRISGLRTDGNGTVRNWFAVLPFGDWMLTLPARVESCDA